MLVPLIAVEAVSGLRYAIRRRCVPVYARIGREFFLTFVRHPVTQLRTFRVIMRCLLRSLACSEIQMPAVVISAEGDRFFPPEKGRALARSLPGATFELTRGNHLWALLDHEKAAEMTLRHIMESQTAR
jgi:pimeloyl-ACP methyl ester carboxylesterase